MGYPLAETIRRSRTLSSLAVLIVMAGIALSSGAAQGRVDVLQGGPASAMSEDTTAKATGGGTVVANPSYPNTIGSFGLNARRPAVPSAGTAEGRIDYVRHKNMADRHVNVPVVYMQAGVTPQPPNMTGGDALLIGDCAGATCPTGAGSVIVYVKDVTDSGANQDIFQIYFCGGGPTPPPSNYTPGDNIDGCSVAEGGPLRSGNIQVRGEAAVVGEKIATAAGSGAYTSTPTLNGIELAGGTFALGLRTAGPGDLEAQLNGVSPIFGLSQQLTITGWIATATVNGGTMTFSGTASLDMGDGAPPITGLAVTGSATATGVTLTVGSWSLGTLPLGDGVIKIE
jgi:hypothetical protein